MSRFHLAAAAAALVLGLVACGGGSTASSQPVPHPSAPGSTSPAQAAGTQVIQYSPWAADGTLASGISASATESGSCFTNSIATTAADAWRCSVGNTLYDPCFSWGSSGAGKVGCPNPESPDSVTVINLTSPLPAPPSATGTPDLIWLLVLADGQHCWGNTGTVATLGGKNEYYLCADGGGAYGNPDQSGATWTITYAPGGATASAMTQENITTAYE